ncbi:MAG: hemerythrin family protein [Gammaproteobacteria bacterium]|nr:hemerythrin family protein [Gammaproteobacteria bacterium]
MTIVWRDKMSVGNDAIDQDHKYLFCLINMVELSLQTPVKKDQLLTVMNMMLEYTEEHFSREEKMQLSIQYSRYDTHKIAHQNLLQKAKDIIDEVSQINTDAEFEQESDRIVTFLRAWIIEHVLKEDMLMKPLLKKFPTNWKI